MARLRELLQALPVKRVSGNLNLEIKGIAYDSRQVGEGFMFVCIKGLKLNGHDFIEDALKRGAVAIVIEDESYASKISPPIARIQVSDSRQALALISSEFYGRPADQLTLIGVTGTNGKTTTTYLIESVLRQAGYKTGLIGTLGNHIGETSEPTTLTTPESLEIQKLLERMLRAGVTDVILEVSSHALALKRLEGCEFDLAVLTNITQDHLDFHKDFSSYLEAKLKLFRDYRRGSALSIINLDDPLSQYMLQRINSQVLTYGIGKEAEVKAVDIVSNSSRLSFKALTTAGIIDINLNLVGYFNIYNALATISVGLARGVGLPAIKKGLEAVKSLPGRFELIEEGQNYKVVVDYAHTPDGLKNLLEAAEKIKEGRKILVFGCGGDRDRGKRPKMGAIATENSDFCIITSDNPRSEEPEKIIQEIEAGIDAKFKGKYAIESDRYKAIEQAIEMAQKGDIVIIAGKGHETYQIFRDYTISFDDRQVAREIIRRRSFPQ